eukprot:CAMPEP_0174366516 /NCGR_PEP_ID=MMETSP0811_2-20130205/81488_1 /TAXON_ID=73025 ORGANISM="Eutreptiella gymnastica-like, Strain CCMP1594" /NCGR_SAMPLE_ID=MMETSP0811_2 /ASSEMBLY_ACC=CAM_ASM_000667 /LENGTH=55 /DNA_ID=CAMNT_0015508145 /DNA_START=394 /DNA_END=558 /DNA_ORIENTATION=-
MNLWDAILMPNPYPTRRCLRGIATRPALPLLLGRVAGHTSGFTTPECTADDWEAD